MPSPDQRLAGRVAIVTGASRGLGQMCALALAGEGARLVVSGRSTSESPLRLPGNVFQTAGMIEERFGAPVLAMPCDVSRPDEVRAMVEAAIERFGRIDIIVNNAAHILPEGEPFADIAPHVFQRMVEVNLMGPFHVLRAALPKMSAQHFGNVINISGRSKSRGSPLEATKLALEAMTIGFAGQLRPRGVAVNSLRPVGFIDTPGMLVNPEVHPRELRPPHSFLEALIRVAMQRADTYSGHVHTDAQALFALCDTESFARHRAANAPAWSEGIG
jgi:3-oxoacyl-[acyl-carrier protein] reductase